MSKDVLAKALANRCCEEYRAKTGENGMIPLRYADDWYLAATDKIDDSLLRAAFFAALWEANVIRV